MQWADAAVRIESLSIKSVTIAIFVMIGVVAIVLSMLAGAYFRESALDAQINSLSRVLEVAAQEMQQRIRARSFDLGMKLAHSQKLVSAFNEAMQTGQDDALLALLDDPFISGFVGFSEINLVKLRTYTPDLQFIGESSVGVQNMQQALPGYLAGIISNRDRDDRLKGIDALWLSSVGPLHSSVIPLGGLRPVGYLEVVVDPVFNLKDIAAITQTPVSIYSMSGDLVSSVNEGIASEYLPVVYVLQTPDALPAFRIVGLEDVALLSEEMARIKTVTITGFLMLALATLLLALWLFSRFMLSPVSAMVRNMREMAQGNLDMAVDNKALREFHELSDAFNTMASQVRMRTNDLERLLDLDDNAILCFDRDLEIVYFNRSAATLFGYSSDEISDLDLTDMFADDIAAFTDRLGGAAGRRQEDKLHEVLTCRHKDGHEFRCDAVINAIDVMGQQGHAIALNTAAGDGRIMSAQSEQRLDVVEQSLTSLLEFAKSNPSLMLGLGSLGELGDVDTAGGVNKGAVREHAVSVMNLALACWEHELGKSKLDLAEESRIWPVYIDKSTPTTRTLDKYLSLDNCPKNPRSKRVVDTAEFVLRHLPDKDSAACGQLRQALDEFRQLLSGVKPKSPQSDG
jgi:PAS domain S-box-containing protein